MGTGVGSKPDTGYEFLSGSSELDNLVRKFDWSKTSIGAIETWAQSLRTSVNIVLQSTVPIVMLWGPDGIMIYNDAYSEFAGARHPQLLGSKVLEGWPEVADFNHNVMQHGLAGKALSYTDQPLVLYRNNVAENIWANLNYSPIMDESGKPAGVFSVVIETTERVLAEQQRAQAEANLKAEQSRLYTLLQEAPAHIALLHGPEHVFVLANPLYMQLVGHRPIVGKPVRVALPEVEGQGLYEILDNVYQTGKPYIGNEVPVNLDRTGDGSIEPGIFNFVYQPLREQNGEITDIFVHAIEVTEQVQSRQQIEEIANINRAITENASTALMIMDTSFRCTFMNPAAEKMTGYTLKQVLKIDKTLHDIIHHKYPNGRDYPAEECGINSAIINGIVKNGEDTFVHKDGTFYPVFYAVTPVMSDGESVGAVLEVRDITEQKRAQEEQQRLVRITHQRNELVKLNKSKDEFISLASHQLRTPATAVKQYVSMVLTGYAGELTEAQQKYLQTAYDSNERQLQIISDLLKTAQLDSDQYALIKQSCILTEIITEVVADMQSTLELKGQRVEIIGSADPTELTVDREELKLVFINLLENASKYSYPNSVITIKIGKKYNKLSISFIDQGVGISTADIKKIFQKFTRVDNDLSDTVTGTGLGLYWVKRIIKLHGGKITVSSKPKKGSTFTVSLPL